MLADSVIAVFDVNSPVESLCSEFRDILSRVNLKSQQLIIVLNKADLLEGFEEARPSFASGKLSEVENASNRATLAVNKIVTKFNKIVSLTDNKIDTIPLSAKSGFNLEKLSQALSSHQNTRIADAGTATLVTNARHFNALNAASRALTLARSELLSHTPTDLVSQDIREALYHLGSITGEITTDEVLGNIFSRFCIGK